VTVWGLIVETTTGGGSARHWAADVLGEVRGTREEALRELEAHAQRYRPQHPFSPQRSRVFRDGDGFLMVVEGRTETFHTRFSVGELIHDSDAGSGPDGTP
jgi:hypothetical protein